MPESLAKQGISGQKGVNNNHDKNTFCLPRQDSWTTRNPRCNWAKWGIIQRLPEYETTGRLLHIGNKRFFSIRYGFVLLYGACEDGSININVKGTEINSKKSMK